MAMSSILAKSFQVTALASALALVGCGTGGGNDTLPPKVGSTVNGSTGGSTSSTTNGDSTDNAIVNNVNITQLSLDVATQGFIPSTGATAKVTVTDKSGKGISGAIVTFASTGGVQFSTTNASVLTNENGEASIFVKPTNINDNGTYLLTATATYDSDSATSKGYAFSLQSTDLVVSSVTAENANLEVGGSTNISALIKDANGNIQPNTTVNFTTSCGSFTETSTMTNGDGIATTTYSAIKTDGNLCDTTSATITATTTTGIKNQTNVSIAPITGNSIVYTTTSDVKLGTSTSGTSSTSSVEFTVFANGKPAPNREITISKTRAPFDFSFVKLGNTAPIKIKTNSKGVASVTIYPGAIPGPVELKASLATDENVFALSKNIAIATGRAHQEGLSISLGKNTLAYSVDGDTTEIIARLVDRVGNAVPDGTVVSFIAEGGKIGSNCATKDGECSVEFSTQNPRTPDGRISILAYVEGDKSYIDKNGNNRFDAGVDTISHNIGDFFRDDNENGLYDIGEFKYEKKEGSLACAASYFAQPNLANTCNNDLDAVLRHQFVLGLAGNVPVFTTIDNQPLPKTLPAGSSSENTFKMYGNGLRNVSMPAGTTISLTAQDNTNYSPAVSIENGKLIVVNAKPNSVVTVTIGNTKENVIIDANGQGEKNYTGQVGTEPPTVSGSAEATCTAELTGGLLTVPNIVNLSNKTIAEEDVLYTFKYKNCEAGDEILITTVAPDPAANTVTKILKFK